MRRPLVAGNWKMNGSAAGLPSLVDGVKHGVTAPIESIDVALCPPFVYLSAVAGRTAGTGIRVGGQNLAAETPGAYTGEVAGEMLRDVGCEYVLVGHSERRSLYGEDSALVARKYARALECGLVPVLCVGETREEREAGTTEAVVAEQLGAVVALCGGAALGSGVIAYEPVWAIGTGLTATPEQAQAVHGFIRSALAENGSAEVAASTRILYGGSVKPDNAAALFAMPDIDGGLIGGASLDAEAFAGICRAAA